MPNILVLTATISPKPNAFSLARVDPAARLRDYEEGLRFYLGLQRDLRPFSRIVFAENSDSDLSSLKKLAAESGQEADVEFLSIYGLDYPQEYARGYGEFLLLDRVMERSMAIADAGADAVIWKVTGRYRVMNLGLLVSEQPPSFDLYCHCRDYPTRLMDQYLLAWRKGIHEKHLKGIYDRMKENETGVSGEVVMRRILDAHTWDAITVVPRFARIPVVHGVRGYDNQAYSAGFKNQLKHTARVVCHRVLPRLWI